MYGSVPAIFKSLSACKLASNAYATEELEQWLIFYKDHETMGRVYKPVRNGDLDKAHKDGWNFVTEK